MSTWEQSNDAVPEGIVQITIYDTASGDRVATAFQTKENASLIVAAPELLAVLRDTPTTDEKDPAAWEAWEQRRRDAIFNAAGMQA